MTRSRLSRRRFGRRSLAALASLSIVPSHVIRAQSEKRDDQGRLIKPATQTPNEKVRLACCGIGNQGGGDLRAMHQTGLAEIVALCDVDMGGPHTLKNLKTFDSQPRFQDFREMFDRMADQIDAVTVGTPDFSHFPIAMLAMSLGTVSYTHLTLPTKRIV